MTLLSKLAKAFKGPDIQVTGESTPWGIAYTVTIDGEKFESSCDGTLWNRPDYSHISFSQSERCRRAVRRARTRGEIEISAGRWPALLDSLGSDMRAKIVAGGLKGQQNARKSRLLP